MTTEPQVRVANAIALMTAWAASPDGPPDLLVDCLRHHIQERPPEVQLAVAVELIMSMTQLCGSLLLLLEEGLELAPQDVLRELALHFEGVTGPGPAG